jgi:hypothetical protein
LVAIGVEAKKFPNIQWRQGRYRMPVGITAKARCVPQGEISDGRLRTSGRMVDSFTPLAECWTFSQFTIMSFVRDHLYSQVLCIVQFSEPRGLFLRDNVLPMLCFWGADLVPFDPGDPQAVLPDAARIGLVLILQENLSVDLLSRHRALFDDLARHGAGFIVGDPSLELHIGDGGVCFSRRTWSGVLGVRDAVLGADHFVTALNRRFRYFHFRKPVPVLPRTPEAGVPLLRDAEGMTLVSAHDERNRVIRWSLSPTLWSEGSFGFGRGLDALMWRGMLWSAKKPFCLAAFPPLGRFRFDDCHGFWRTPEDLAFVDVMAAFEEVPNLGICLSAPNNAAWAKLAEGARAGRLEVSPHVASPEIGIFNALEGDAGRRAAEITALFAFHRCPIAHGVSDHNHELTPLGLAIAHQLGLDSRMNVMRLGETWDSLHRLWRAPPFGRMNYVLAPFVDDPAIFTAINHAASFSDSFTSIGQDQFICTSFGGFTEDRWDFLNGLADASGRVDLDAVIERLSGHAELALTSLFFLGSISHSHFTCHLTPELWRRLLLAYRGFVDPFGYRPAGYDTIVRTARRWYSESGEPIAPSIRSKNSEGWHLIARAEGDRTIAEWIQGSA